MALLPGRNSSEEVELSRRSLSQRSNHYVTISEGGETGACSKVS